MVLFLNRLFSGAQRRLFPLGGGKSYYPGGYVRSELGELDDILSSKRRVTHISAITTYQFLSGCVLVIICWP
jgi:hypothetical protein